MSSVPKSVDLRASRLFPSWIFILVFIEQRCLAEVQAIILVRLGLAKGQSVFLGIKVAFNLISDHIKYPQNCAEIKD